MIFLETVRDWVVDHGAAISIGVSIVLLGFAALIWCSRSIATRHRLAGLSLIAAGGYLALAIAPLPRLEWAWPQTTPVATASPAEIVTGNLLDGAITADEILDAFRQPDGSEPPTGANPTIARRPTEAPSPPLETESTIAATPAMATSPSPIAPSEAAEPGGLATDSWLTAALLFGTALFAAHLLLGWWRLRGILKRSSPASERLSQLVPLPPRTRIRIAADAVQPFCCGVLRRTIVLPRHLATTGDAARFVLLHECAHVRAGDPLLRLVAAVLRVALFWHPLFWWLQRQLRFHGELLADDAAAHGSVPAYVRCMMTLSTNPDRPAGTALATTIFRRRSELFRRLEMMLERDEAIPRSGSRTRTMMRLAASVALVACCASTFGVQRAVAQQPGADFARGKSKVIRELRAEIETLRAEIESLRRYADRRPGGGQPTATAPPGIVRSRNGQSPPAPMPPRVADPAAGQNPLAAPRPNRIRAVNSQPVAEPAPAPTPFLQTSPAAGTAPEPVRPTEAPETSSPSNRASDIARFSDLLRQAKDRRAAANGAAGQNPAREPFSLMMKDNGKLEYRVQKGDSLTRISRKVYGNHDGVDRLMRLNPGIDPRKLKVGERLIVQSADAPRTSAARSRGAGDRPGSRYRPGRAAPGANTAAAPRNTTATPPAAATARAPRTSNATRTTNEFADLVTRCIELKGDIDIAKVNLECAKTPQDREICKIRIRTKERQHRAVRGLIETEIEQAKEDLDYSQKLADKGFITTRELRAAKARLDMLSNALR